MECKGKAYHGLGALSSLKEILRDEKSEHVFLVTGRNSYVVSGAEKTIEGIFKDLDIIPKRFTGFSPNPRYDQVKDGLAQFRTIPYDTIIAVGGGSAIDVAKAVKLHYLERNPDTKIPLVAVPTTIGSGSEATHFIVYYKDGKKQSLGKPNETLPDYVILDPKLTYSLPKEVAAASGMDALSQALESLWSIHSTEKSDFWAQVAITKTLKNLKRAVNATGREMEEARAEMQIAANYAGMAINITRTTACHSIAYPLTSMFGIAHGHACALTLGSMFVYNSEPEKHEINDARGTDFVIKRMQKLKPLFGVGIYDSSQKVREKIEELMVSIGLEVKLSRLGIDKSHIQKIVEGSFSPERMANNPRKLNRASVRQILQNIL